MLKELWCDVCKERGEGTECSNCQGRSCISCNVNQKCPFCGCSTGVNASCSTTGGCGDGKTEEP